MLSRLFSVYQVADLLGSDPKGVTNWIKMGWLQSKNMPGGSVKISEESLIEFLQKRGIDIEELMVKISLQEGELPGDSGSLAEASSQSGGSPEETSPKDSEQPAEAGSFAIEQTPKAHPTPSGDPVNEAADAILQDAVANQVTHVHLEPSREGMSLRVRIDGVVHDKANFKIQLPKQMAPRLIRRFKDLAALDPTTHPQEGQFHSTIAGKEFQFHVATCPTVWGEKVVVEVDELDRTIPELPELGFSDDDLSLLQRLLKQPNGIILIAGPPGNGKTTTLEAMLAEMKNSERTLVALESGREIRLDGVTRCQVPEAGLTFAEALAAFGKADPDVVMLADVTDPAVDIVSAALGGVLIMGSVSARSTITALKMMLESAPRWAVAAGLLAVVDQRLVRRICPECKQRTDFSKELLEAPGLRPEDVDFPVYHGPGCKECSNTGYLGRTGVFSVLHVDEIIAEMLRKGAEPHDIYLEGSRGAMKTLRLAGLAKVRAGITSLTEFSRIFPSAK